VKKRKKQKKPDLRGRSAIVRKTGLTGGDQGKWKGKGGGDRGVWAAATKETITRLHRENGKHKKGQKDKEIKNCPSRKTSGPSGKSHKQKKSRTRRIGKRDKDDGGKEKSTLQESFNDREKKQKTKGRKIKRKEKKKKVEDKERGKRGGNQVPSFERNCVSRKLDQLAGQNANCGKDGKDKKKVTPTKGQKKEKEEFESILRPKPLDTRKKKGGGIKKEGKGGGS